MYIGGAYHINARLAAEKANLAKSIAVFKDAAHAIEHERGHRFRGQGGLAQRFVAEVFDEYVMSYVIGPMVPTTTMAVTIMSFTRMPDDPEDEYHEQVWV